MDNRHRMASALELGCAEETGAIKVLSSHILTATQWMSTAQLGLPS